MDTPVGMVASAPSPDAAAPPTEDPERADDCHDIILDERGEDQPCPAGTAADSAMDTPAEVVANALSLDAAALPMEEALGEHTPPTFGPTKTLETQDLGVEDAVVLLHKEEMTTSPKWMSIQHLRYCSGCQSMLMQCDFFPGQSWHIPRCLHTDKSILFMYFLYSHCLYKRGFNKAVEGSSHKGTPK